MKINGYYFYGNEVSDEGKKYNRVDYATLAKAFQHVLCNGLFDQTGGFESWDLVSGSDYDEETDTFTDIFQWYIVSGSGAEILEEADEILYYNPDLDLYLWGVTHWGTSWDYVLTNIEIATLEEQQLSVKFPGE